MTPRKGSGCEACNRTGYRGRVGLYEVLEVTDPLRERILAGGAARALRRAAMEDGMLTLRQSGLRKIAVLPQEYWPLKHTNSGRYSRGW